MRLVLSLLVSLTVVACTVRRPSGVGSPAETGVTEAPAKPGAGGDGEGIAGAEEFVQGFFFSKGTGYYGNAGGHYCALLSFAAYRAAGGPFDVSKVSNVDKIPRLMVSDGLCYVTPPLYRLDGFLFSSQAGFYRRDDGFVCVFTSPAQYFAAGGPRDLAGVKTIADYVPDPKILDGTCLASPVGNLDGQSDGAIFGWALDTNATAGSILVHVYADPYFQTLIGVATANESRPDVNADQGIGGAHGFHFVVPPAYRAAGTKLYVYAVSVSGTNNPLITGAPWTMR